MHSHTHAVSHSGAAPSFGLVVEHTVSQSVPIAEARLQVRIPGQRFTIGPEALAKAPAVTQLSKELARFGVDVGDIAISGMEYRTTASLFGRSEDCAIRAEVFCRDLAKLDAILKVLDEARAVEVEDVGWGYGDEDEQSEALVERGILEVKAKAEARARLLGVAVVGVRGLRTHMRRDQADFPRPRGGKMSKSVGPLDGCWGARRTLAATVTAEFDLAPFSRGEA